MMNAHSQSRFVGWTLNRDTGLQVVEDLQANQNPQRCHPMGVFFCAIADSQTCQTLRTRANIRTSPSRSHPGFLFRGQHDFIP